jgi:hypothetical protein
MSLWYEKAEEIDIDEVLMRLGASERMRRWSPCPMCKSETENHSTRNPLAIRKRPGKADQFYCNACQGFGNIFDLVAWSLFNESAGDLQRRGDFKQLKEFFVNSDFVTDPLVKKSRPVLYPPQEEVRAFCQAAIQVNLNKNVNNYLKSRNINSMKAPAKIASKCYDVESLTKVECKFGDEIRMVPWWPKKWLSAFPLLIPLVNFRGELVSVLGRTIYKNYKYRKSTVPIGFSTQNLYMLSPQALAWIHGQVIPEKIWVTEGEIDYLTVAQHGQPTIGIRNGRVDSLQMLPWKDFQRVYIATHNDEAGNRYAKAVSNCVQPAQPMRINFNLLGG